jgi:hypothetical protein
MRRIKLRFTNILPPKIKATARKRLIPIRSPSQARKKAMTMFERNPVTKISEKNFPSRLLRRPPQMVSRPAKHATEI